MNRKKDEELQRYKESPYLPNIIPGLKLVKPLVYPELVAQWELERSRFGFFKKLHRVKYAMLYDADFIWGKGFPTIPDLKARDKSLDEMEAGRLQQLADYEKKNSGSKKRNAIKSRG